MLVISAHATAPWPDLLAPARCAHRLTRVATLCSSLSLPPRKRYHASFLKWMTVPWREASMLGAHNSDSRLSRRALPLHHEHGPMSRLVYRHAEKAGKQSGGGAVQSLVMNNPDGASRSGMKRPR